MNKKQHFEELAKELYEELERYGRDNFEDYDLDMFDSWDDLTSFEKESIYHNIWLTIDALEERNNRMELL